ncbi:hypothetical protein GQ43DRAFT_87603 [Delitschia confertaspora ATCC 74209]|uniref:Uncharacterized protein n=1 Tax=Delitschia confertaspora ATCC 74209 TaxID=1513339 RepID=A0A9P4JIR3_9PLEO|nr:hypothetical protein GQ43DRAFT_87603 [Delitschia confertaspora ATCC 74209]
MPGLQPHNGDTSRHERHHLILHRRCFILPHHLAKMPLAASRVMMRHSTSAIRRAGIRNASSTSEAAGAAKDTAAKVQSKASDGLSRVTSSAGPLVSKAGSAAAGVMSRLAMVGGRTGRLVGRIQSRLRIFAFRYQLANRTFTALIPPTIYYSKVGLELGRLVFQQRKMDLPSVATFQSSFARLRNPSSLFSSSSSGAQPTGILNRVRNLSTAEWASVGVVAAEVIGFFSVGEMIGRMKLVGYRSSAPAHH